MARIGSASAKSPSLLTHASVSHPRPSGLGFTAPPTVHTYRPAAPTTTGFAWVLANFDTTVQTLPSDVHATQYRILLDIAGHYYWTLLRWSLLHVRLAAQRGELAVALGAARLVARAQVSLSSSCPACASRPAPPTCAARWPRVCTARRGPCGTEARRGSTRVHAVEIMSRWSGGTRARAPMQVQGRRVRVVKQPHFPLCEAHGQDRRAEWPTPSTS